MQVLAFFHVFANGGGKRQLTLGVDVDFGNAQRDRLADLIGGNAGSAMENQRHFANLFGNGGKRFKGESRPVFGIFAVNVADSGGQHGNAQVGDLLAFVRISALAHTDNAVFLAADRADFGFQGESLLGANANQLFCFFNVLGNRIMRTVEHNGRKSGLNAAVATLVGAMVQVKRNRNGDLQFVDHRLYHIGNGLKAAHIFPCALGNAENDGRIEFLRGLQDRFRPFQVVDVELTYGIMAGFCFYKHFFCGNKHFKNLLKNPISDISIINHFPRKIKRFFRKSPAFL